MFTANKLRKENIAEYLLYMWQVEDLLRAENLSIESVEENIISRYPIDDQQKAELKNWYEELIEMMRIEGVKEKGHLQINNNIIIQLTDLHQMLLKSVKYPEYGAEFYRTLPIIVELRAKSGENAKGELETCFNALYGMLMMRLQKREMTAETMKAMAQISKFVALLATYFHKDKIKPLFDKDDYDNL